MATFNFCLFNFSLGLMHIYGILPTTHIFPLPIKTPPSGLQNTLEFLRSSFVQTAGWLGLMLEVFFVTFTSDIEKKGILKIPSFHNFCSENSCTGLQNMGLFQEVLPIPI